MAANPQPWFGPEMPLLVGAASRIAVGLAHGRRLADVAFPELSLVLLALSALWYRLSPPGSAARQWARFGMWLAMSSISVGLALMVAGPPSAETVSWGITAVGVGGSFILLFY